MIDGEQEKTPLAYSMEGKRQIDFLKRGVDVWNKWRESNPEIKIHLCRENLSNLNLEGVNFTQSNLREAKLNEAKLMGAKMAGANLIGAELVGANLSQAWLYMVNLSQANLERAILISAKLIRANLSKSNCVEAKFQTAFLNCANLRQADCKYANLSGASLFAANLDRANFTRANFTGTNLSRSDASGTTFTGATFDRICLEDWRINDYTNLKHIICDYFYLKYAQQKRFTCNRNFAPDDFTKSYQDSLKLQDLPPELFEEHSASKILEKNKLVHKKKILILTAIPHGLRLDKEIREVFECIRRAVKRDMFEVDIRTAVRRQDIRRAIAEEKPQIVHFCGHGLEDGSLLLEDDGGQNKAITPEGLAALFELHADYVNCVLLNACHSAKSAEAISKYINYAIGMNQEIQDKSAIGFTQGFYDGLGYAIPENQDGFQRAFQEGLVAIKLENPTHAKIPVIYPCNERLY